MHVDSSAASAVTSTIDSHWGKEQALAAQVEEQQDSVEEIDDDGDRTHDAPRHTDARYTIAFALEVRLSEREEVDDGSVVGDVEEALGGGHGLQQGGSSAQMSVRNVAGVAALEHAVAGADGEEVEAAEVSGGS